MIRLDLQFDEAWMMRGKPAAKPNAAWTMIAERPLLDKVRVSREP
jgi:hypothetical protein